MQLRVGKSMLSTPVFSPPNFPSDDDSGGGPIGGSPRARRRHGGDLSPGCDRLDKADYVVEHVEAVLLLLGRQHERLHEVMRGGRRGYGRRGGGGAIVGHVCVSAAQRARHHHHHASPQRVQRVHGGGLFSFLHTEMVTAANSGPTIGDAAAGFGVRRLGLRVYSSGFRIQGSGFRI